MPGVFRESSVPRARPRCSGLLVFLLVLAGAAPGAGRAAAAPPDEPESPSAVVGEATDRAGGDEESSRPIVHDHVLRVGVGVAVPIGLGGLEKGNRESVFELGASGTGDSAVAGSFRVEYGRGLLALRLAVQAKRLAVGVGNQMDLFDGVEKQVAVINAGGGFLSLAALVGVQWEPVLYAAEGGGEGLSIALSAFGGYEHISLWGSFEKERISNFRLGERSFHWIVERLRLDAEVALRWRHVVGGESIRHLLGFEMGVAGSVYIPHVAYASGAIAGVEQMWGSWMAFVRLTWEIGLPDLGQARR